MSCHETHRIPRPEAASGIIMRQFLPVGSLQLGEIETG